MLLTLSGMTLYSGGVVLQKKGSAWMTWKDNKNKRYTAMLFMWSLGILFSYVISALPNGIASKFLPPHIISAVSGWGIITSVFLSFIFLKEKLYLSDIIYSIVIASSIFLMCFYTRPGGYSLDKKYLYPLLLSPLLLLLPVFLKSTSDKLKTILLSLFSGISSGLTIVFMNLLVKESQDTIAGIIGSPNFIIYIICGLSSAIAMQAAYRYGDIILIAPLQTSLTIIYPVICSYFLLNSSITGVHLLSILIIVISCWGILKKR